VSAAPSRLGRLWAAPDFFLRLAFFFVAPFFFLAGALRFPLMGALINVIIAVSFFFLEPFIAPAIARFPWLGRLLRRQLAFEAYYRKRPPRAFLYYVFYPALFPYWLANREARAEFLLFKGYTLLTLLVLVGTSVWQYFTKWLPELGPGAFLGPFVIILVFEAMLVFTILMPVSTTIIAYHLAGRRVRLAVLFAALVLGTVLAITQYAKKRHEQVPYLTAQRMEMRTRADRARSKEVRTQALKVAVQATRRGEADFEPDVPRGVEVLGPPIEKARAVLARFYKEDETLCFHLIAFDEASTGKMLVLFGDPMEPKLPLVWIGIQKGQVFDDETRLPRKALGIMRMVSKR
jgi:hypothetical protein